jgi:hypothetical protein
MTHDRTMGITNTEWCSHGQHYVKSDEITWLKVGKIGKRKLCESCKNTIEDARKELKNVVQ